MNIDYFTITNQKMISADKTPLTNLPPKKKREKTLKKKEKIYTTVRSVKHYEILRETIHAVVARTKRKPSRPAQPR